MKKNVFLLAPFAVILALTGCDTLTQLNKGLDAVNNSLGAATGTPGATTAVGGGVIVPAAITQQATAAFIATQEEQLQAMINDAKPAIINIVGLSACGAESNRMSQYRDPESSFFYHKGSSGMQYHKSGCVTPIRIHGWKKKSANAFSFVVDYVSPQSEESTRGYYTAIKQPNGEWLFGI